MLLVQTLLTEVEFEIAVNTFRLLEHSNASFLTFFSLLSFATFC